MRFLAFTVFIVASLLLAGCGPIYQTNYEYVPPKTQMGRMCAAQCQSTKMMCQQMCASRQDSCESNAKQSALISYEEYKSTQIQQGQPVSKTINDFLNDSQCQSISCGCDSDFNTCYTACGGQIIPHTVCVAFCDKAKK